LRLIHQNKLKTFKTTLICFSVFLSGCGGGGDSSTSTAPLITAIHVTPTAPPVVLLNGAINDNTYTISVRKPGVLAVSGLNYNIEVDVPANVNIIHNTCAGRVVYGQNCQFTINYNNPSLADPVAPRYIPQSFNINITATPNDSSVALNNTTHVKVLNDPLNATLVLAQADIPNVGYRNTYRSNNILNSQWGRINFNVPAIQTYSLGYSPTLADDDQTAFPVLALKTRCMNKLIYLVVQRKMTGNVTAGNNGNITVKYHALISSRANDDRVVNGDVSLRENGLAAINVPADINAHGIYWSGSQNIPRLQELITTVISHDNNYFVSYLSNITPHNPFVDPLNQGSVQVITVHSLLTNIQYHNLLNYLNTGHGVRRLVNLVNPSDVTLDGVAKDSLITYRTEVAEACVG